MIVKPLARWTLGPVDETGKEILRESVRLFARLYPEFDRVICYNHIDEGELQDIASLARLHAQSGTDAPCDLASPGKSYEEAIGCGWKLAPPRLRQESHELFIDNDIVITKRFKEIDHWLCSTDRFIISEGISRKRMFGIFDNHVPPDVRACAGLFGLPPDFDFTSQIMSYIGTLGGKPLGGYDEQGMTTAIVVKSGNYILVPLSVMHISEDHVELPNAVPPGIHFVAANRKPWHRGWARYKKLKRFRSLMT